MTYIDDALLQLDIDNGEFLTDTPDSNLVIESDTTTTFDDRSIYAR
jgi:hypothetical protein